MKPLWRRAAPGSWQLRLRQALWRSIQLRLVLLFLLLAFAVTVTFFAGMQKAISVSWRDGARPLLADYVDRLVTEIGSPPDVQRAQALVQRLPIKVCIEGPEVQWASHASSCNVTDWRGGRGRRGPWDGEGGELLRRQTADGHTLEFAMNRLAAEDSHHSPAVWLTLGGLLLLTTLAYCYVHRLLRPLDDIRRGALRFGAGDFSASIPVRHPFRPDELGQLAGTINAMGRDIHQMLEAKRTLLLAISHELRSPLTRARLHTELLPETIDLLPHRNALLRDLGEMARLINDLLESERLVGHHTALHKESSDICELAYAVVAEMNMCYANRTAIDLKVDAAIPMLSIDTARMRLMMRNLLDNAFRHGVNDRFAPQMQLRRTPKELEIVVRDFGIGVPEEQIYRLADPFYRLDAARERSTGGVGLGLYLSRLVAEAHGGTLVFSNAYPGLRSTVTLPLTRAQ